MFERVSDRNLPPIMLLELPMAEGTTTTVDELRNRFFDSEFGRYMYDQELRFSQRYGYERDLMKSDLGNDVCPVGHQFELPLHLQEIIDTERIHGTVWQLSDEELAIVAFTCSIHDIGECEHPALTAAGLQTVGDIPAGGKTELDRANESAVRRYFYDQFYSDVDPAIIERVEAIIAHKDTTILHEIFEAAHEIQTEDTVKRAEKAICAPDLIPEQLTALAGIVNTVRPAHRNKLKNLNYFRLIENILATD